MKKSIYTILLLVFSVSAFAQDYKTTLELYAGYAENGMKGIIGEKAGENNGIEIYNITQNPPVGNAQIAMIESKPVLIWKVPLSQSEKLKLATEEFIQKNYGGWFAAAYVIDKREDESKTFTMTTVYESIKNIVFRVAVSNLPDPGQNTYTIFFYPKKNKNTATEQSNAAQGTVAKAPAMISEKFAGEIKALLNTDVAQIKGKLEDNVLIRHYASNLPLTGFKVSVHELSDKYMVNCVYDWGKNAEVKPEQTSALMDELVKKLSPIGYTLIDSKDNSTVLVEGKEQIRRIVLVNNANLVKLEVVLDAKYNKNTTINIYKFDKPLFKTNNKEAVQKSPVSVQISKNFAAELKALIDANTEALQGELKSEEKIAGFNFNKYQCKLPLSGFDLYFSLGGGVPSVGGSYNGKATPAIMNDIMAKLETFKKDYALLDSRTDKKLLEENADAEDRKILLVDEKNEVKAKFELRIFKKDGSFFLMVDVPKIKHRLSNEYPEKTSSVQTGENFAIEFQTLIRKDVEDIKGAKYDDDIITSYLSKFPLSGFDVKLKEIMMDKYIISCKPDGKISEATIDEIATKLTALKNQYMIFDSKEKPQMFNLKGDYKSLARRILVVDISENIKADIQVGEDYKELGFTIFKFDKPLRNK